MATDLAAVPDQPKPVAEKPDYCAQYYDLAVALARRYSMRAARSDSADDLRQVALLGLVRAAERYDPDREVPFAAYATSTIVGEMKHYLRDRAWAVRPPRRVQNLFLRTQEATSELTHEMGRPPTTAELGQRLDANRGELTEALTAGDLRRLPSIDAAAAGDDRTLADRLPADDRAFGAVEDRLALQRLLSHLPERERRMVRLRYLNGLTQTEIAERMSLSQAHVQRMLVRSIDQLRALAKAS